MWSNLDRGTGTFSCGKALPILTSGGEVTNSWLRQAPPRDFSTWEAEAGELL